MHQLIAQGTQSNQRWRRPLRDQQSVVIGRAAGTWSVPWDDRISRRHALLEFRGGRLSVTQLEEARNPIFFQGQQCQRCGIGCGDHFVIGSTIFSLVESHVDVSEAGPLPLTEQAFTRQFLETIPFSATSHQIEVLSRLPQIISGAASDDELYTHLVNLLLSAIPAAGFIAIVAVAGDAESAPIEVLHWDGRAPGADAAASEPLIRRALAQDRSVVHLWDGGAAAEEEGRAPRSAGVDWAFCTPVGGQACRGWAIYVAGGSGAALRPPRPVREPSELQEDLKFAELVATTLGSLRDLRQLEHQKAALSQFISPGVLEAVAGEDPEVVLAPREADVSVLFCDLRGFALKSERSAGDLMGLLNRVGQALSVMTRHILEQGGVIGDFHGDAAMGFWGWPLCQENAESCACRAALGIRTEFAAAARQPNRPLADFRIGIGIASGKAVAGKIGTVDQVKVTVFGPVVNLAARLQDMTKILRAPILLDEATAVFVREHLPPRLARVRRVARVRPYGMDRPVEVSELLPPVDALPGLTDENIASYEAALDALLAGDWDRAFALLHHVPAEDRVKDFLTIFIAQNNRTPPENWDGVIPLDSKS